MLYVIHILPRIRKGGSARHRQAEIVFGIVQLPTECNQKPKQNLSKWQNKNPQTTE